MPKHGYFGIFRALLGDIMGNDSAQNFWEPIVDKCLRDLKARYPNFSEVQLSQKINIARSTLNRLANGKAKPKLDNIIKLIIGSGNKDTLRETLVSYDSEMAKHILSVLEAPLTVPGTKTNFELEKFLQDPDVFIVYLLTCMPKGTNKKQIINVLGNPGLEALPILENANLIYSEGDHYHSCDKAPLTRSFEGIRHHLLSYAKFYKTAHVGKKRNYIHSATSAMSLQGIEKLQTIHREYHKKILECLHSPENQGDIPMFSVGFCDSFTSIENENSQGEN